MMHLLSQIPFLFSCCWVYFAAREMGATVREIRVHDRATHPESNFFRVEWAILLYLLGCAKCISFWAALIVSRDLTVAVFTAIAVDLYFSFRLRYL